MLARQLQRLGNLGASVRMTAGAKLVPPDVSDAVNARQSTSLPL